MHIEKYKKNLITKQSNVPCHISPLLKNPAKFVPKLHLHNIVEREKIFRWVKIASTFNRCNRIKVLKNSLT